MKKFILVVLLGLIGGFILIGVTAEKKGSTASSTTEYESDVDVRMGMTKKRRLQIYKDFNDATDSAIEKAENKYPKFKDRQKRNKFERNLLDKYDAKIREKYDITKEEFKKIVLEGVRENWHKLSEK